MTITAAWPSNTNRPYEVVVTTSDSNEHDQRSQQDVSAMNRPAPAVSRPAD